MAFFFFSRTVLVGGKGCLLLIDGLHKLANDEGYALDTLDLFLSSH